jgi:integrase
MVAKSAFLLIEEQWAHMKGRQKGGTRVFDNLFSHLSHHASATATIRRRLSVAADRPLTPYDLRHAGIVVDLQVVINDRLKTGNFWHTVADLSVQVGHGSIELTLATYVGTAAFLYM